MDDWKDILLTNKWSWLEDGQITCAVVQEKRYFQPKSIPSLTDSAKCSDKQRHLSNVLTSHCENEIKLQQHGCYHKYSKIYVSHASSNSSLPPHRNKTHTDMAILRPQRNLPLIRFRKAVRTVQLLMKVMDIGRHGAKHHQNISWTHIAGDYGTTRRPDDFEISFDPMCFKANREKYLSKEAKAILSLYPSERTEEQIKLVLLALNQTVDAFGEFPIKMQQSFACVGSFEAKRLIIRQGHVADNFYVIISGTAVVTLLDSTTIGEQCVRTVAFLRKGNSFGELALMHGARRSATVTCQTNVELLAIERDDFIDIFMHKEKDQEPEHIRFLRSVDQLNGWPIGKLPQDNHQICLFTFFRRGVLLCRDSNLSEWIYVIKSGTCRVLKDLYDTKPNIPGLECVPYTFKQTFTKLPPIPHPKIEKRHRLRKDLYVHAKAIQSANRWPSEIHKQTLKEATTPALEHQHKINQLFDKMHKVRHCEAQDKDSRTGIENKLDNIHKVFVQIQKLVTRDLFGLEQTVFGMMNTTTSCSLVSDGAECILISKKFFMQHLTDDVAKRIRKTIQPIPTEESLQQKLQDKINWDAYKSMTVSNLVVHQQKLHEHEIEMAYL